MASLVGSLGKTSMLSASQTAPHSGSACPGPLMDLEAIDRAGRRTVICLLCDRESAAMRRRRRKSKRHLHREEA